MKKINTFIFIAALSSLTLAQNHTDRNNSAGCDSTCSTSGNQASSSSSYTLNGKPVVYQKTIPVFVLDTNNIGTQNGTMVIQSGRGLTAGTLINGNPDISILAWNRQYALSNPKNEFFFNGNDINSITSVNVINFDRGS